MDWDGQRPAAHIAAAHSVLCQPYRRQTFTTEQQTVLELLMTNDVPFRVVEHCTFRRFVGGLNSAYLIWMPKRTALMTWVEKQFGDAEERTEAELHRQPGKRTIIVDGFKAAPADDDRRQ